MTRALIKSGGECVYCEREGKERNGREGKERNGRGGGRTCHVMYIQTPLVNYIEEIAIIERSQSSPSQLGEGGRGSKEV